MNKSELIEELTDRAGYNPKLTDKMVRIFFDRIKAALSAGAVSYTHLTLPKKA